MKKRYVVRVVIIEGDDRHVVSDAILDSLRYAGLVRVHEPNGLTQQCFDLVCPAVVHDSKVWSEQNAQRMQTFGINAVSAPATE